MRQCAEISHTDADAGKDSFRTFGRGRLTFRLTYPGFTCLGFLAFKLTSQCFPELFKQGRKVQSRLLRSADHDHAHAKLMCRLLLFRIAAGRTGILRHKKRSIGLLQHCDIHLCGKRSLHRADLLSLHTEISALGNDTCRRKYADKQTARIGNPFRKDMQLLAPGRQENIAGLRFQISRRLCCGIYPGDRRVGPDIPPAYRSALMRVRRFGTRRASRIPQIAQIRHIFCLARHAHIFGYRCGVRMRRIDNDRVVPASHQRFHLRHIQPSLTDLHIFRVLHHFLAIVRRDTHRMPELSFIEILGKHPPLRGPAKNQYLSHIR